MTEATPSPLPLAGGAGGGHPTASGQGRFKPRATTRARDLRGAASPAERRLWTILARRTLAGYKFSRQMPVGPYFTDFLCREAKLIVEVDGNSHDTRGDHDARRDSWMVEQGYQVLRFANEEVMGNLEGVAQVIAQTLTSRCPPPTPPASGRGAGAQTLSEICPEQSLGR